MKKNEPVINTALAAYGMSGRVFHAPLLDAHAGFKLHSILQRSKNDARQKYPDLKVVSDYQALLDNEAVELIIVNTPEYLHYEMASQALEAGKHVVLEKAFTPTTSEARQLIDLAQKQAKMLSVFQNSRWHGDFLTIKQVVDHKLLGELVDYEAHYDRYRNYVEENNWKEEPHPGTGVLYNLGSHMIDQVLVLFGWPQSVQADIRIQRPGGKVEDNFELILAYDQLKVTLKSSYLVREPGPRYVLHGSKGSFVKHGADPQEALLKSGRSPLEEGWGQEKKGHWGKINTDINGLHMQGEVETLPGSYLGYYDSIYAAIREGKEPEVKASQAMQVIAIIEAAIKSNKENRKIFLEAPP
ncbi:scyllo-inositol 2-dehydrogenase (NADP+) [Catalinimonas alkaloidigena]|uniref:Gfo/Idh/MocA family oxidoreductase n=1 Tax=Catalinimonas alkaloidigena TaxID=1075417 RepID=UPI0024058CDA|nr:Gfo/Idh/MocA family oxidoreductase [Catalinimonas alkaloidigena]MDF9798912.1 scyllo-inositol 2-dehydrogenase (NADP+) [Catalinimonas alkaloidigena]